MTTSRTPARNRLLVLGAVPAIGALAVAVLLVLLVRANDAGRAAYDAEDYADAHDTFAGLRDLGLVEPWVRPFNAGAAAFREEEYVDAVGLFEDALDAAPSEQACTVRINLALSHEAAGALDRRRRQTTEALLHLRAARVALAEGGCDEQLEKRIGRKIRDLNSLDPSEPDRAPVTEQEKIDRLERLNEEARQSRDDPVDPTEEPSVAIQW